MIANAIRKTNANKPPNPNKTISIIKISILYLANW